MTDALRELGHDVVGVVTAPTPHRPELFEDIREQSPVEVYVADSVGRPAEILRRLDLDLAVCSGFSRRLSPEALAAPRLGIVNGHPSLLPRWRGPNPFGWTFRAGDDVIGYTFHLMDEDFDTGPILAQGTTPLADDDSADTVWERVAPLVATLLPRALRRVEAGERGDPQRSEGATYAPRFEDEYAEIDWGHSARDVHNQVRSWFLPTHGGLFGAHTRLDGERIRVKRTTLVEGASDAAPGTILARDRETIVIQCGDAPLRVLETAPA